MSHKFALLLVISLLYSTRSLAQPKPSSDTTPDFPKQQEIDLALGQAERALSVYSADIAHERAQIDSPEDLSALRTDREKVGFAEKLIERVRKDPGRFHQGMGYLLLNALEEVSRRELLCASDLDMKASEIAMVKRDYPSATKLVDLGNVCLSDSSAMYALIENLRALVFREIVGKEVLLKECLDITALAKRPLDKTAKGRNTPQK